MAFEKIKIDPELVDRLTASGHPWRSHNVQQFGIVRALNMSIGRFETTAKRLGNEAQNGLFDRAHEARLLGERALSLVVDSEAALVRNVDTMLGKKQTDGAKTERDGN